MAKKHVVKDPADSPMFSPFIIIVMVVIGVVALGWVSLQVGNWLALEDKKQDVSGHPIELIANLAKGKLEWPSGATVTAVVILATIGGLYWWRRRAKQRAKKGRLGVDDKAIFMGSGAGSALSETAVRAKAAELGVELGRDDAPGVPIGVAVSDGTLLYGSYEDLHLDIWGPRQGKSTSRVIPAILSAIGPVIATSNKRDVVDATRDIRARKGPTFVFDPQSVAGEETTWYWDPMAWVGTSEIRAAKLAGHFADSDDGADAKSDAFFDPEGEDLLAGLFLAAAVARRPITEVWHWVTNPADHEPIEVLNNADKPFAAKSLASQINADPKTRDGIYGTAKKMARCLKLSNVHPWVTPQPHSRMFDEMEFLDSGGTLYCLSAEGRGSAAPLVSALTEAVVDVAMLKASRSRGGRLAVPLLAVLDEAANVVRWKDLPKQYSHFGSRGIVVMTVLQSWAQGVRCWGADGMKALWAAANIRVLGSGVDDTAFLQERSDAIGDHAALSRSVSESGSGKSISSSKGSSRTFAVFELLALPRGRAIVFPSGGAPLLVRTVPWWESDQAEAVKQSIDRYDPHHKTLIKDIMPAAVTAEIAEVKRR